jgi:hypothetical protein
MTAGMTAGMVVPAWMREPVTAEQYGAWTAQQCAGIEIMDGMVLVSPSPSKRHNRKARPLTNALDAGRRPGLERRHPTSTSACRTSR